MKKISLSILILILVGILSPMFYLNAQIGYCADRNGNKLNITFENCKSPNSWQLGEPPKCDPPKVLYLGRCGDPYPPPPGGPPAPPTQTNYILLAPIDAPGGITTFDPAEPNALGRYLNPMIKIFIGICAVLAVIMIVIGGLEYMTSDLPSMKEGGKGRIIGAIFGLVIALGAYTLLYTINPDLLITDFIIPNTNLKIENFEIAGGLSFSRGDVRQVSFNKEAYPAAKAAYDKTGVEPALILAIFSQETSSGVDIGSCSPSDPAAKMQTVDKTALRTILAGLPNLGKTFDTVNVSCAGKTGYGGAIGYTQFLPSTWIRYKAKAAGYLGHEPNPWNASDALMMAAVYLEALGGVNNPRQAACGYFGQCSSGGVNYADQIIAKRDSMRQQIADAIRNGTIKP